MTYTQAADLPQNSKDYSFIANEKTKEFHTEIVSATKPPAAMFNAQGTPQYLTGEAAKQAALDYAKNAWRPDEDSQISNFSGSGFKPYSDLEQKLKSPDTRVVATYGDVLILAPSSGDHKEQDKDAKLLIDNLKKNSVSKPILNGLAKKDGMPLAIEFSDQELPQLITAESPMRKRMAGSVENLNFHANYDKVIFNPRGALVSETGEALSPDVIALHELSHANDMQSKREFEKTLNPQLSARFPHGTMNDQQNYLKLDQDRNGIPDHEERATNDEIGYSKEKGQKLFRNTYNEHARKHMYNITVPDVMSTPTEEQIKEIKARSK